MMMDQMSGMTMWGMGLGWILLVTVLVLAAAALVKYLFFKSNRGLVSAHVPRCNSTPYVATKHALTGLTRSLSLDGREYNIACGQIDIGNAATTRNEDTARGRLQATGRVEAEPRMDVEHVARGVVYMATLPLDANVQFMTVMATKMPYIGRG
jgi:NADP-dependent 3-hydroxy acid dehydrogenase YdfG